VAVGRCRGGQEPLAQMSSSVTLTRGACRHVRPIGCRIHESP
jgi:hypothetical protein